MRLMSRELSVLLGLVGVVAVSACARKPAPPQAGQPEAMAVRCEPGKPIEYPLIFTIGGRPYTRFRTKMWARAAPSDGPPTFSR